MEDIALFLCGPHRLAPVVCEMGVWLRQPLTVKAPSALYLLFLSMGEVVGYPGVLTAFLYLESPGPQLHVRPTICRQDCVGGDVGEPANLIEGGEWPLPGREITQLSLPRC